jgi:ATPases involved in chromosome partitioning
MIDQASELRKMVSAQNSKPSRVITVTGGKGGVGKSSVALNLAIALSRRGHRVLIIDTDFGFSNIDVMLGVNTRYDLLDVVKQDLDIRDIIEHGLEGVQFISGGSGVYELTQLSGGQLMNIVNNLKNLEDVADTVIFDTGAGVSDNILRLIHASHETLVVTTPEPTAVVDAYALIKIVGEQGKSANIRLIINKADNVSEAASVMDCIARIAEKNVDVQIDKLGYIMRDVNMHKAIRMQVPILVSFPNCTASLNINSIASKLIKMSTAEPERPGIKSFLDRFLAKNSIFPG